jgi:glucose-6-phosphate isomerase
MPVTAVASDGGAFVPLLGKVINNMSRFTGLPFVMPKGNFDESTPYKYWSEALKVLHFSQPMFRRVENDDTELMRGNKEFVYGQNNRPAYPDVIKDEEIIRLTADAYDITEFPGGVRKVTDMEAVLRDGAAIDGNNAYYMHRGPFASREDIEKSFYGPNLLRYDITVLPPQMWGDEPVKTYGHFHNPVEKPEMYQVLAGECVWIQQKEEKQADGSSKVVDFVATRATAGDIVVMMPGYGHISVNISDTEPLVMANWLTWNQKSYYGSFGEKKGAAFHLIKDAEGKLAFVANPLYPESATLEIKQMAPKENRKFGIYQGSAIYRLVQQPKAVFDRLTDFLYHPEKYDGELTPEKMLSDQVAPGDIIPVKQPVTADDFSKEMYSALSSKNGSFVKAVKGLDEKGIKGAVVVDAKTIFRNAGTVEALQKIREAGEAMQVVVWTNNMGDFNDLRKLKVDEKLNIKIQVKALATVITELENEGINPARITIIDSGNIRQVQEIAKMAEGVNVTYLQAPNAQKGRLNFMPLIVNRAVALAAKDDDVNKAFGTTAKISGKLVASEGSMLDAYQKQHKLSEADLAALDLYTGSNIVPLTKTTETLAAIQTG